MGVNVMSFVACDKRISRKIASLHETVCFAEVSFWKHHNYIIEFPVNN